jgi:hypothetical protein
MKIYSLVILLLFFIGPLFAQDVNSILSKTESAYLNMKTYLDSGKVVSSFYNNPRPFSRALLFKTAYSDNGSFNFEFYQLGDDHLYIVNKDVSNKVQVWDGSKIRTGLPFANAIAGSVGISSSASIMITNFLMPGAAQTYSKNIFSRLKERKLAASEVIKGNTCYKITGSDGNRSIVIWISQKDFLIRKLERDEPVNDFRVKNTYQFFPYTLKMANKNLFAFRPRKIEL